ncbi:MAG: energy transducer TonB [Nitrosomonadales bacterium]|jgi:protein TonB|nr:energy transducer TonB [Nitrosomonadales bacterium]
MNNDSKLKYTTHKISIAVVLSLLLHLMFFAKLDFNKLLVSNDNYHTNELEVFVEPEEEKIGSERRVERLPKQNDNLEKLTNNKITKEGKEIIPEIKDNTDGPIKKNQNQSNDEIVTRKKSIDKTKILSNLSKLNLNINIPSQNKNIRIKNISAKSPEYIYRLYFEAWKKKVERMGAMNYPDSAKINNSFSNLIMKVTINFNGEVDNISIIKSSGKDDLDLAAIGIVRNGSPYAPFSEQMKREVDKVNITRIWRFTEDKNLSTNK